MNRYLITAYGKRSNLYWNGCGWTEFKRIANVYGKADGEQVIAKMSVDKIMANLIER